MDPALPVLEHDGRVLDWRPRFDPRSLAYRIGAVAGTALPTTGRLWPTGPVLDQGAEGACVGFGCAGEAAAEPVPLPGVTDRYALAWYRKAQRRDTWPGEAYSGTSVLAGLLEGRARGLYAGFRWAKTAEELAAGIVTDEAGGGGPAIIGVEWRSGSYATDDLGVLQATGDVVGGHCLIVVGFVPGIDGLDPELAAELERLDLLTGLTALGGPAFVVLNSWGDGFGKAGRALVPLEVMRGWFRAGGEFAIPQGRKLPATMAAAKAPEGKPDKAAKVTPPADRTLHPMAVELECRDRITEGVPVELGQETVTVTARRHVAGVGGTLVRITSTAGTFTLRAASRVTVRRTIG